MRFDSSPHAEIAILSEASKSKFAAHYLFSVIFGFATRFVSSLAAVEELISSGAIPKLLILSLNKPTDDICTMMKSISSSRFKPFVLVLTDDPKPDAVVRLFEANADEVIRFPVSLSELAYRVRARSQEIGLSFEFQPDQIRTLDLATDVVQRAKLTDIEAKLIGVLLKNEGKTVSREYLSQEIDKTTWNYGNRKFDVHMSHIRKKLDRAFDGMMTVRTVRASGYALDLVSHDMD